MFFCGCNVLISTGYLETASTSSKSNSCKSFVFQMRSNGWNNRNEKKGQIRIWIRLLCHTIVKRISTESVSPSFQHFIVCPLSRFIFSAFWSRLLLSACQCKSKYRSERQSRFPIASMFRVLFPFVIANIWVASGSQDLCHWTIKWDFCRTKPDRKCL